MAVETWDDAGDIGVSKGTLPDGVYEVQIKHWEGKPYDKGDQKGRIVKLRMEIVGVPEGVDPDKYVGEELKEDWWLTRRVSKEIFFQELKAIGFDTDSWSDNPADETRKGAMLPLAIKYCKLKGLTLRLKRFKQGEYANLRFVGRASDTDPAPTISNADVLAVADVPEGAGDIF